MKINKVLIANRGEIAIRVMKTAKHMGYAVVAVYSDPDKETSHVAEAGESIHLPGNTLSETYLNIPAIIKAAKASGANAIHPGYGFLSENPLFAEACENEGITFVGPSSASIKAMGNKIAAREIAKNHGVPVTPGLTGTPEYLLNNYKEIGFPILVKAAAGGGGKGMRIVRSESELEGALQSTSSEALNNFGDNTVYIERFFEDPRHIEVQVLGDKHGNIIHLYERECSVQRRHQKIIEEAPSPTLTPEVREKICASAVTLAKSIGYYNAGTIEFLVDHDLNFYFLEMNTRIQVEHPVTEMITGVDIVKEQFKIAEGEYLTYNQSDLKIFGHAIELRVYAEDPLNNFMPSPGKVFKYWYPQSGHIRVDDSKITEGAYIHSSFDPMISKVIAAAKDRKEAIAKLSAYIPNYLVMGIKTNLPYLQMILNHPDYQNNKVHTRYIDNHYSELSERFNQEKHAVNYHVPLLAGLIINLRSRISQKSIISHETGFWRLLPEVSAIVEDKSFQVFAFHHDNNSLVYELDGTRNKASLFEEDAAYRLDCCNLSDKIYLVKGSDSSVYLKYKGHDFTFHRTDTAPDDSACFDGIVSHRTDKDDIMSPMPGKVMRIKVKQGSKVQKGDLLMIIEAMKMENNILAPFNGTIDTIHVKEGANVDTSSHLIHLLPEVN